jgi:aminobutyraldehyde dehydrogenase
MMAVWKMRPRWRPGTCQVLKPSEQTPLTTLASRSSPADDPPAGRAERLTGDGVPAGEAIVKHPTCGSCR